VTIAPPTKKFSVKIHFFFGLWGSCTVSEPTRPLRGISIKLGKWVLGKWIFNLADAEFWFSLLVNFYGLYKIFFIYFSKLWRAIPDVLGRWLSETGGGKGLYPLTDCQIWTGYGWNWPKKWRQKMVIFDFWRKVPSLWRHPGRRESRIHFRFSVSDRARLMLLELSVRFGWKLLLPVWWATENCENKFRSYILAVFLVS